MTDLQSKVRTRKILSPEEEEKAEYWLNMQLEIAKTNPWFPWMQDRRQRPSSPRLRSLAFCLAPWLADL